ncbi:MULTISPECIES: STAS domain-containing protein [Oscillospiraceae]|jgi:anti-anti-sigma factor|uniref:Anti-sigma factor antagonist n=1 Tax=Lawsonibacter faecis TaxID=2763052 RepID=A0A8J6JDV6_9FIRM|nr:MULTISPECIES: STAS domain-containing protein [Oscillospiraceae]MTQ96186.1 anti-sigma factor antagonist [Pseudoflavonifractor sp. BIOML-A16]MTR06326.1 anti-sigma factor antagonist [Pseudoflavonifractor sp. BIOML-A15]MTR33145.1 anti-sigma factor antagonist [Pseudoflavonifractor sp. BIOML-A14]MTR73486.1 anti-sigma factor antagonist [Pseudoflavonifractor sp. BIOML-A18]MTS63838.1 anti-sigma factor antagonist [Pseudoflavonifractor sp. BIOML-A5]MTS72090.1 anti-sigma factor antagonist [Pseudoflavo
MAVTCTGADREMVLTISGEVDHHGAGEIMREMDRQVDAQLPRRLALDLSGVTFMDSSGIAVILRAFRRVGELGGQMTVRNVPAQAGKVLRAAGLERIVKFES